MKYGELHNDTRLYQSYFSKKERDCIPTDENIIGNNGEQLIKMWREGLIDYPKFINWALQFHKKVIKKKISRSFKTRDNTLFFD